MTPREINQRLTQSTETICRMLLPGGKRVGHEWECGDVGGAAGHSLKVRLEGPKAGQWCDFAAGADMKGDLLGLYAACQRCHIRDAIAWAKQYLNIYDPADAFHERKKPRSTKPLPAVGINDFGQTTLSNRGISVRVAAIYGITVEDKRFTFPAYKGNDLIMAKFKDLAKAKKEEGYEGSTKGTDDILIGWQAIQPDCREVVITEGEWDMLSYAEQGIPAMSIPRGAGSGNKQKWIELDYDDLEQFDTIYISMDMDEYGRPTADDLVNRLGNYRCKIIDLPLKDANECLLEGHDLYEFVRAARSVDPKELKSAAAFKGEVIEQFYPKPHTPRGAATPWQKVGDCLRFRPGEVTEWVGINGHGKSMVLGHATIHGMANGERCCIASMEFAPPVLLKRMFQQIGGVERPTEEFIGTINAWLDGKCWIVNVRGTAKASRLLEVFEYAWRKFAVTQFVVDSLAKCGFDEDDYNGQKRFVESLCDFAARTAAHVHLVLHARKREDEHDAPGKMDAKGTGALTDMVDNVISVWRNKKKEHQIDQADFENQAVPSAVLEKADCILEVHKQRNFDWEKKIALWFNGANHQYLEKQGIAAVNYTEAGQ